MRKNKKKITKFVFKQDKNTFKKKQTKIVIKHAVHYSTTQ